MEVWGHRGSRVPGPENTLVAVTGALSAGADGVEVDLRRCADGRLVLAHDPVVAGRPVREWPAEQLAGLGVPLALEALVAVRGRGRLVAEVKNAVGEPDHDTTRAATVTALLGLLTADDDVLVSSFDPGVLATARSAGLATALLSRPGTTVGAGAAAAAAGGYGELHAHITSVRLDRAAARRCHDLGLRLVAWTLTRPGTAPRWAGSGVDAVIADDPAAVVAALAD